MLVSRYGCFPVISEARSSRILALSPRDAGVEDYVHHADLARDKGIEGGPSRWDYGELVQPDFNQLFDNAVVQYRKRLQTRIGPQIGHLEHTFVSNITSYKSISS